MKEVILHIHHLSCGYGGHTILRDISFSACKGDIIGIIGPNGSGKTTLLRAISGIIHPEAGEIRIQGEALEKIPRKTLAGKISVVSQAVEPAHVTVEEYVLLGRLPFFRKYQFVETQNDLAVSRKYMELTDTYRLKDLPMHEISGGERQLASIARALAQEPILLLLDEPTSHLDIRHQAQILTLIRRLNRELGLTVLMVLHDLNLASEYSDRLILLSGKTGCIYREGIPEEVVTRASIEEVYQTEVLINRNPLSGKPYVMLAGKT